jgi:hypothetical protein
MRLKIFFLLCKRGRMEEEPFQHVSYKKEPKPKPVKEEDEDDWDNYSFHCGCPYDPYPDDPFCGYDPPDQDPNSEKIRKDLTKTCKKKCGKSKGKVKAKKSEGEKNLDALKKDALKEQRDLSSVI